MVQFRNSSSSEPACGDSSCSGDAGGEGPVADLVDRHAAHDEPVGALDLGGRAGLLQGGGEPAGSAVRTERGRLLKLGQ